MERGNPPHHHVLLPLHACWQDQWTIRRGVFDIFLKRHATYRNARMEPQDKGNSRVNTTLAKQVANWVVLYSPVQMASDLVEHYEGASLFSVFRDFDPIAIGRKRCKARPGEFIALVRRAKRTLWALQLTKRHAH